MNIIQRRFNQKYQSLCHRQTPQSLLFLFPFCPPLGQDLLLGRATSPTFVADKRLDVDIGQGLCKQTWPERFDIHTDCFNEGVDHILRQWHLILVQDKGWVDAGELGDRGCGGLCAELAAARCSEHQK